MVSLRGRQPVHVPRPWIVPIALVLLGLGFALIPWAQGNFFFYWDNAQQHYAQTLFLQNGLQQLTIPQWWPDVGLGFPATAEGQAAHYHPMRLLLALLFPAPAALMWEVGSYLAIAGLSTYLFLREFRLHRTACFFGAVSHMFCGFAIVYIRNLALHRSFCLLPLAILLAERFARRGSARVWLAAILVLGVQFLAGHPSFAIVTVVATSVYVALRVLQSSWARAEPLPSAARALFARLAAWGAAAVLSLGVAAVQVVPTLMHAERSQRQGGLTFESSASVLRATPRGLGQLLLPYAVIQGDWLPEGPSGDNFNPTPSIGMYSGMLCVVLAPVAVYWRRRWPDAAVPLAGSFALAIGFALGSGAPLFPFLRSVPGLTGIRYPSRFLLWAAFCLSCLAAIGVHRLIALGRSRVAPTRRLAPIGISAIAVASLAGFVSLTLPETRAGVALSIGWFAAAAALAALLATTTRRLRAGILVLVVALAAGDLWFFRAHGQYARSVPIAESLDPPESVRLLKKDPAPFRVLSLIATENGAFSNEELKAYLQADLSSIWGIDSADVFLSLFLKRYFAVRSSIVQEIRQRPASAESLASFLAALNVKYLVAPAGLSLPGWHRIHASGPTAVWQSPVALPRAFLVGRVVPERFELTDEWRRRSDERLADYRATVSDWFSRAVDAQILDHVMASRLDYAAVAEVAGADAVTVAPLDDRATVQTIASGPDEMRFIVDTTQPAFLVISSSWYPGWTATLNDRPARLFETNWVMTGLAVPAGRSDVVLRYSTPGFRAGAAISLAVLVAVGFLLFRPGPVRRILAGIGAV